MITSRQRPHQMWRHYTSTLPLVLRLFSIKFASVSDTIGFPVVQNRNARRSTSMQTRCINVVYLFQDRRVLCQVRFLDVLPYATFVGHWSSAAAVHVLWTLSVTQSVLLVVFCFNSTFCHFHFWWDWMLLSMWFVSGLICGLAHGNAVTLIKKTAVSDKWRYTTTLTNTGVSSHESAYQRLTCMGTW